MDTSIINSVSHNYVNLFSFQTTSNIISTLFVMELTSPKIAPLSQNSAKKSTSWSKDPVPKNDENSKDYSINHSVNGNIYNK